MISIGGSKQKSQSKPMVWGGFEPYLTQPGNIPDYFYGPKINENWLQGTVQPQYTARDQWQPQQWQPMTGYSPWFNQDKRFTPEESQDPSMPFGQALKESWQNDVQTAKKDLGGLADIFGGFFGALGLTPYQQYRIDSDGDGGGGLPLIRWMQSMGG